MNDVVVVIPARYKSSRFPGKPLAEIAGKPMIWWVYNQVNKAQRVDRVIVATDNEMIYDKCIDLSIDVIMTRDDHETSTARVHEVSEKILANTYVVVNGDEPLINSEDIDFFINELNLKSNLFVSNVMTSVKNPVELIDFTNIKIVTDENNNALYFSRSPIPYPKSSIDYKYYKHVGILAYSKAALDFFVGAPKGKLEIIEDINELRFLENGKQVTMVELDISSLSVDTLKDLEEIIRVLDKNDHNK